MVFSKNRLEVFADRNSALDKQVMFVETMVGSNWRKWKEFEYLAAFYLRLFVLVTAMFFFLVNNVCDQIRHTV